MPVPGWRPNAHNPQPSEPAGPGSEGVSECPALSGIILGIPKWRLLRQSYRNCSVGVVEGFMEKTLANMMTAGSVAENCGGFRGPLGILGIQTEYACSLVGYVGLFREILICRCESKTGAPCFGVWDVFRLKFCSEVLPDTDIYPSVAASHLNTWYLYFCFYYTSSATITSSTTPAAIDTDPCTSFCSSSSSRRRRRRRRRSSSSSSSSRSSSSSSSSSCCCCCSSSTIKSAGFMWSYEPADHGWTQICIPGRRDDVGGKSIFTAYRPPVSR